MPDDLARELLADLLDDAAAHPVAGFDAARCRRLARVLRTQGAAAPASREATAAALELARIEGPHRHAWSFWAARLVAGEARRWRARHLVQQWVRELEPAT